MPREIYLVKVGMSMTEGMVSEWFIPDGGEVKKGELVYALETEKVNLDVDAEYDGIVKHLVDVGVMLSPGDVVGYIFESDEDVPNTLDGTLTDTSTDTSAKTLNSASPAAEVPRPSATAKPVAPADASADGHIKSSPAARRLAKELGIDYSRLSGTGPGGRIVEADVLAASASVPVAARAEGREPKASPLAKRLAAERGIDLRQISGTGPGGRIVQADIAGTSTAGGARPTPVLTPVSGPRAGESVPIRGMRKTIASRMHQSLQESAQLTMTMEVIMDDAVKMRNSLIDEWASEAIRPTYTDLVIKAAAKALQKHPMMNSSFGDDEIILLQEINIGMAVALPEGLMVPVIRNADSLAVKSLVVESSRLAKGAREGALGLDDYAGGTFTVTALGMYGVDSFTPIINQHQAGILGVNRVHDGVAWDGDKPVRTSKMNLSLTWDHRIIDGAPAAEFLTAIRDLLAAPYRLLV